MSATKKVPLWFYLILALTLIFVLQWYVGRASFAEEEISSLTPLQEKQLEIFFEMNRQLINLAILAIGGMAAFLFNRYKNSELPSSQIKLAVKSWVAAGLSIFFGYLTFDAISWMLREGFFNLSSVQVMVFRNFQFWTFALSVFYLIRFVYCGLRLPEPGENVKGKGEEK